MKVHLLYRDQDPDPEAALPALSEALVRDLGLDTVLHHMAGEDSYLQQVARHTVLSPVTDLATIRHRQEVLDECLRHPDVTLALYRTCVSAVESRRRLRGWFVSDYPASVLHHSVQLLDALMTDLEELRRITDQHAGDFASEGFRSLFAQVRSDLSDDYFVLLEEHLRRLKFPTGVFLTAQLGEGCKGTNYVLRKPRSIKRGWRDLLSVGEPSSYSYRVPERDEAGAQALSDLRERGINLVADALAQSTDHILSFFAMLRWELGFYICCLNLHEELRGRNLPLCFPVAGPAGGRVLTARGLYDVSLALRLNRPVVGNDVEADGRSLVVVTGANQGGKSTLLRSIGLAQLLLQSGMFAPGRLYRSSVATGLFTHYKREEDASMERGKLDEELTRMSEIVDLVAPGSMVLCNESFASTNEREGSRIARQIVDGLVEAGVRVLFVTHMFDLAHGIERDRPQDTLFLRPERLPDGRRTFRLVEGDPRTTSHGHDLYERVFGSSA